MKYGQLNGKSIQFHLNGQKNSECEFYNRHEIGYIRYWNEEGVLILEHQYQYKNYGHFQSSIRVGEWRDWDDEGNIIRINHFLDNEFNGRQLEFYNNGQIKIEEFYTNGVRDSTLTEYHSNGQIFRQVKYRNGEFIEDNPSLEYHPNGQISGQGNLKEGRKEGFWKYFYENGKHESEGEYGTYIYPHEHGDIFFYHKQGLWKYWFPNGKLKAIGSYDDMQIQDIGLSDAPDVGLGVRKDDWKYFDDQGVQITYEAFIKKGLTIQDY